MHWSSLILANGGLTREILSLLSVSAVDVNWRKIQVREHCSHSHDASERFQPLAHYSSEQEQLRCIRQTKGKQRIWSRAGKSSIVF